MLGLLRTAEHDRLPAGQCVFAIRLHAAIRQHAVRHEVVQRPDRDPGADDRIGAARARKYTVLAQRITHRLQSVGRVDAHIADGKSRRPWQDRAEETSWMARESDGHEAQAEDKKRQPAVLCNAYDPRIRARNWQSP